MCAVKGLCVEALRSSHAFTDLERRACEAMDGHPVHVLKVHGEYDVVMVTARREGLGVGLVCGNCEAGRAWCRLGVWERCRSVGGGTAGSGKAQV